MIAENTPAEKSTFVARLTGMACTRRTTFDEVSILSETVPADAAHRRIYDCHSDRPDRLGIFGAIERSAFGQLVAAILAGAQPRLTWHRTIIRGAEL